jgi:F-type H+-transporting ATPase subunit delta
MNDGTLARRYAGALFEVARKMDLIDLVESDLGLVSWSLETMPRLQEVLQHPLIPPDGKKGIADNVFEGKVELVTLQFIKLLIDKRRETILSSVEAEYVRLANALRNTMLAYVTSAVPLTDVEQAALQSKLEGFTGKNVKLELAEDPDLIGGLTVRIGDTIIDGSVKGYLNALRNRLLGKE